MYLKIKCRERKRERGDREWKREKETDREIESLCEWKRVKNKRRREGEKERGGEGERERGRERERERDEKGDVISHVRKCWSSPKKVSFVQVVPLTSKSQISPTNCLLPRHLFSFWVSLSSSYPPI